MSNKPDAIVFDWDDTLVSSWYVVKEAVNKTLVAFGKNAWSEDEARNRIGPPAKVLFTELFGEENWEKADKIFIEAYKDSIKDNIKLYDCAVDILNIVKTNNVKSFIVSSKRGNILKEEALTLGVLDCFDKVVGAGDAPEDKPSNASVCFAIEDSNLDSKKNNIWFVGDGFSDLECSYNAGCKTMLIETKLPSEEKIAKFPPYKRFKSLIEFKDYLLFCLKE